MTVFELQEDLIKEIEWILQDIVTKNTLGEEIAGVKGYAQQLPEIASDEEDPSSFLPYFIVRVSDGATGGDEDPWMVTIDILFGVYHDDKSGAGYKSILNMIQRLTDRFVSEPLLNKLYRASQEINWAIQEENTYPFYFGGVEMKFEVRKMGRRQVF